MNCVYIKEGDGCIPVKAHEGVLNAMGLYDGQLITTEQMWEVIRLNAASFVGDMKLRKLVGEPGIPDTTDLENLLGGSYR